MLKGEFLDELIDDFLDEFDHGYFPFPRSPYGRRRNVRLAAIGPESRFEEDDLDAMIDSALGSGGLGGGGGGPGGRGRQDSEILPLRTLLGLARAELNEAGRHIDSYIRERTRPTPLNNARRLISTVVQVLEAARSTERSGTVRNEIMTIVEALREVRGSINSITWRLVPDPTQTYVQLNPDEVRRSISTMRTVINGLLEQHSVVLGRYQGSRR